MNAPHLRVNTPLSRHLAIGGHWYTLNHPVALKCTHRGGAFFRLIARIKNHILDEYRRGFQYERHKQVHVDVVSRAVQLPAERASSNRNKPITFGGNCRGVMGAKENKFKM